VQGRLDGRPGVEQREQAADAQGPVDGGMVGTDEDHSDACGAAPVMQFLQAAQPRRGQQGDAAEVDQDRAKDPLLNSSSTTVARWGSAGFVEYAAHP
jgi:hypothetical protein